MALIIDIADAIVASLNEHEFSQDLTAERKYLPIFELPEMGELHVTVVAQGLEREEITKGGTDRSDVKVVVFVQKKLTKVEEDGEVDDLMDLAEEIVLYLEGVEVFGGAVWSKTEHNPIVLPEHLDKLRQFTSVITLSLTVM